MATIIGRKREQEELRRIYESDQAELVVVYGRRRVGKTYLVREFFKGRFDFQHTGLSPLEYEENLDKLDLMQRTAFASSLGQFGIECDTVPACWIVAFDLLRSYLIRKLKSRRKGRVTVFIDELPWMDTAGSGFLTAFEHFWNGWAAGQERLLFIICGSATTWITDHIINNNGGLYGRVTREIKLAPFSLAECEAFFRLRKVSMSRYDQLQSYMIFGGIPYYLGYLQPTLGLAQNVDALFFAPTARLRHEFDRLFSSVFRKGKLSEDRNNVEYYKKIVAFLSQRREGYTRKEISEGTQISYGGNLTELLRALETSDFIRPYLFYKGNRREMRYKLIDFFVLFSLRFVREAQSPSQMFWQENQFSPAIYAWRGLTFEEVCWNHQRQLKEALGIASVRTEIEPWRSRESAPGAQVDLVIQRSDRHLHLCEMKFMEKPWRMDADDELAIRTKVADFIEETGYPHPVHPTLISSYGVKDNAHSRLFLHILTMDILFKE